MSEQNVNAAMMADTFGRAINAAFPTHSIPPAPVAVKAVQDAIEAYAEARAAYWFDKRRSGTTQSEYDAEQADLAARADALEKGQDDPRTPAQDKWRAERAAHLRLIDARAEVATRREKELRAAVAEHRQALIDAHQAAVTKRADKIMRLLDQMVAECNAVALDIRLREFAETFPNWPGRDRTWTQPLIVQRKMGGEAVTSDDLLDPIRRALADVLAPPEPPEVHVMGQEAA